MNWKEINDKYPLAFLEWVRDNEPETESIVFLTDGKEEYLKSGQIDGYFYLDEDTIVWMPYYFDKYGITIDVSRYMFSEGESDKFPLSCSLDEGCGVLDGRFPDRISATEAGVIKAFEIREEQLRESRRKPIKTTQDKPQYCKDCKNEGVVNFEQHLKCKECFFIGNQQSNFEPKNGK